MNFIDKLQKPFFVMAPLANVTDAAFRQMIAKYGKPDIMFTEFVSADGLMSEGRDRLLPDLLFTESERPLIAQLFTADPEKMFGAAKLIQEIGFDGIDINMGCPDRSVMKQGAGACLMKDPLLARELMNAAKAGAPNLTLSVKTRVGDTKNNLSTWLPELLAEKPNMITVHARTRKEMSKVPANWERIKEAVEIAKGSNTVIVGNGDVIDLDDARAKAEMTGCGGIMLGRAIFGNPWLFNKGKKIEDISIPEKMAVMIEHSKLFEELLGNIKSFHIMRKHYKAYAHGFDGAKELRVKLMQTENVADVEAIVNTFLTSYK
ncbi:MAG TPA: tRNA-dihydrouridine synthase [bacterium]|nr:tRNA-dihydrouridine synthase [bacterium]